MLQKNVCSNSQKTFHSLHVLPCIVNGECKPSVMMESSLKHFITVIMILIITCLIDWFHIRKWREYQAVIILLYDGVCLLYEAERQPYTVNINSYIVFTDVKGKSQLNQAQQSLKMNVSYIIQDRQILSLCKFWFTVISLTSSVSNRLFTVTEMTPPFELTYWVSYSLCSLNSCSCYSNCK